MTLKKHLYFTIFFLSFSLFVSCSKKSENFDISIVASNFPCYDATRAILGDTPDTYSIRLKLLIKPGTEVHSYDPTPQDLIDIQNADLFVYIGGESDEWIEELLYANKNYDSQKNLALINFVNTLEEFNPEENEKDEKSHHEANDFEADEHIWTSPANEIIIVSEIFSRLKTIAEKKQLSSLIPVFEKNAANYISQINATAELLNQALNSHNHKFIVMADRFPFAYFADYYKLGYSAAFSGCSTAVETSFATIENLVKTVQEKKLSSVFYIELGNHKIADIIAEETGTKAYCLESIQNVTKDDFINGETWVSLMSRNAKTLKKGL